MPRCWHRGSPHICAGDTADWLRLFLELLFTRDCTGRCAVSGGQAPAVVMEEVVAGFQHLVLVKLNVRSDWGLEGVGLDGTSASTSRDDQLVD